MILIDPRNPNSQSIHDHLAALVDLTNPSINFVFGGDGWMLECIRTQGSKHPFLGINAGTLGFLMNSTEDLTSVVQSIQQEKWTEYSFPRLHFSGTDLQGNAIDGLALNDIYTARIGGSAANLRLDIDGVNIVDKIICDGMIVATALGSTAYSSSAGGSPSHPLLGGMHITPICAHTPRLRPFIIPDEASVHIEILAPERRQVQAVGDGFSYGKTRFLSIRSEKNSVQLIFLKGNNFTERMVRKILRNS
jgi:NAD+ kinase